MGDGSKLEDIVLINTIKKLMNNYELRKKMSDRVQELVDGHGINRIVEVIINKLKAGQEIAL